MPVIDLKDINVIFKQKDKTITAVKEASLQVEKGDIYGIVGYSGAGKSTLVRTINLLQRPTSGSVTVNGTDMLSLNETELRTERQKIGMIFQHFNLMDELTVFGNIALPLQHANLSSDALTTKVNHLLDLVGLKDRANNYPAQLSGGQKQRVAIARALANDPQILLSDEATSALDPRTTNQILALLKRLNAELGLTIVLITHEMQAVKAIANKVAVMEEGTIIERGSLLDIFTQPQRPLTRDFINTATNLDEALINVQTLLADQPLAADEKLVQVQYVGANTAQPLLSKIYADFGVSINLLYSDMEILANTPVGICIAVFKGNDQAIQTVIDSLNDHSVKTTFLTLGGAANA